MNATRPQSSMLLNVNDPIQVHLLVETALGDSKEFEILSQEEVDDLKKQVQSLTQRIEQTRQNLAIQSKYRDAAISMARLYSPSGKKKSVDGPDGKKRHSILGHNRNSSDTVKEADQERLASERKCEELAAELFHLEKRLMEPQSRLLKHTAGILQMTHKGPKKTTKGAGGSQQPGMPGSPESMYTYHNSRISMEPVSEENFFDERSLYRSAERLDALGDDSFGLMPRGQSKEQMQMIAMTEQKLEDLNKRLREVIVNANPQRQASFGAPPLSKTNSDGRPTDPGETLQSHLDYLEKGITAIDQEHSQSLRKQEESEAVMEETIEELNHEVHNLLLPYNETHSQPPPVTGQGLQQQLQYFQNSIGAIEIELSQAANKSSKNAGNQEQMETVMMGLWDIIQSGEEEIWQRKKERRQTRMAQNLPEEEDMSSDEDFDPNEQFSLQAFSAKVQWLYTQATRLKDQKKVLQRQIKLQRELNSKSDATKAAELMQKVEELQRTKDLLTRTERDSDSVREQLSLVMEKLDEARQNERMRDQSRANDDSAALKAAQGELEERNKAIEELEVRLQEMQDDRGIHNAEVQGRISEAEGKIAGLMKELAVATEAHTAADAFSKMKEKELEAKEKEMEDMNMELARLQTEVTIARAELDGAYGSRAQRAAEVAANPAIQKEIDDLSKKNAYLAAEIAELKQRGVVGGEVEAQMKTLKKELEETIEEYEQMTKASIEWEKEREQLEQTIDKLRDERENLEAQLSDEKVRWLGMKSPGEGTSDPSRGAGSTSTTVLKNEFKKMMRDTRQEHTKTLRVCSILLLILRVSH
jgi:hypothetical protein